MRLPLSSTAGVLAPLALLALSAAAPSALAQPARGPVPSLAPPAIGPPTVEASPATGVAWVPSEVPEDVRPPGITAKHEREPAAAPEVRTGDEPGAQTQARKRGRGLSVAMLTGNGVYGLRGELELWSAGGWSGGIAAGYSTTEIFSAGGDASFDFGDLRGVATAGYTLGRGVLRLRTQAALGAVRTEMTGIAGPLGPVAFSGTYPFGEIAVQAHLAFGRTLAWALVAGPMLSIYSQTYLLDNAEAMRSVTRTSDVSFTVGVRRRL
jgi:hypothetical protein